MLCYATITSRLQIMVDRRGIEPRPEACKATVLPLSLSAHIEMHLSMHLNMVGRDRFKLSSHRLRAGTSSSKFTTQIDTLLISLYADVSWRLFMVLPPRIELSSQAYKTRASPLMLRERYVWYSERVSIPLLLLEREAS